MCWAWTASRCCGSSAQRPICCARRHVIRSSQLAALAWWQLRAEQLAQARAFRLADKARWPAYAATLARFVTEARATGARVDIVIMPVRTDTPAAHAAGVGDAPAAVFRRRLLALAQAQAVPVHDAWALFEKAALADRAAWYSNEAVRDIHLSPLGHAAVAKWLTPRLKLAPNGAVGGPIRSLRMRRGG